MITREQLAYLNSWGTRVMDFAFQPSTEDIANCRLAGDQFVVQLIGDVFTVYDLTTLKRHQAIAVLTLGLPIAEHYDFDTAVMTALLSQ